MMDKITKKKRKGILTEIEKNRIRNLFNYYKRKGRTLKDVANKFDRDQSTIGKFFDKEYGEGYRKVSKLKSYQHTLKDDDKEVLNLFKKYKKGADIKELAKFLRISSGTLQNKFNKRFSGEYEDITKENMSKKVPYTKIKVMFNKYKEERIPLLKLANDLGLAESSLTSRFKNNFKEEYKLIAKSRRDERKITKEDYIRAFLEYEKTNISLTTLAHKLGIRISSLRPMFIRLFGERYHKIANKKANAYFLNKRGKIAEKLALEYLNIIGIGLTDVRNTPLIKNSLKRPDFVSWETFIEVKSYFIKYSGTRLKGYKEILESYLNKDLVDGNMLKRGMIISLSGFSKKVWEKALEDGITLVDHKDLIRRFEENNKYDLIKLMRDYFLPL